MNNLTAATVYGTYDELDAISVKLQAFGIFFKEVSTLVAVHNEQIMDEQVESLLEVALQKVLFPACE